MKQVKTYTFTLVVALMFMLASCSQPGGDSTGSEFMPDMAHSVAYEANYYNYYYNNTWGTKEEYYQFAQPRQPIKGTVPRRTSSSISVPSVGDNTPYYYGDSDAERERATAELVNNPYPITDAGIAQGKELYNINCAICHGAKGDGNGYLVRDDGGVYPVQPAILTNDEFVTASNGRYYHSIMYGKNLMGSYKDKLSYEDRWQVIHYIRTLQAKEKGLTYNQMSNTLNAIDRPAGEMKQVAEVHHHHDDEGHDAHGHDDHGDDAHHKVELKGEFHDHEGHEGGHHHPEGDEGHEHHDHH